MWIGCEAVESGAAFEWKESCGLREVGGGLGFRARMLVSRWQVNGEKEWIDIRSDSLHPNHFTSVDSVFIFSAEVEGEGVY